jgi:tRNA-dihydrouridine synthase B
VDLARRLADDGVVAGLCIHPRSAAQRHKGKPDYELVRRLADELPVPVLVSGGLQDAESARAAFHATDAAGVMLARGSLGNPWLFERLLGARDAEPSREEILDELDWVLDRAVEHLGDERATRYLRKFYPWYLERLGGGPELRAAVQTAPSLADVRALVWDLR